MFREPRRAVLLAGALALAAAAVTALVALDVRAVREVDDATLRFMVRNRWAPVTGLALVLNVVGASWVTLPVRVGTSILLAVQRRWWHLGVFLAAVLVAEAWTTALKRIIERPRPPGSLVHVTGFAFPSGHATATAVTALAVVLVLTTPGRGRLPWIVGAMVLSVLMGLSRAYLAAHWLSDGAGGVLIGAWIALGTAAVAQELRPRRSGTEEPLSSPADGPARPAR